jgi:putative transposase
MYSSDLTDGQWIQLEPLLKGLRGDRHGGGRPRKYDLRRIVDAMLYVVKTGCQWRQMPANFPSWQSVYQQFRVWRDGGVWQRVTKALREQGRKAQGRNAAPTVAVLDSQSAKTALKGGSAVTTRARRSRGRKRHIAADTQGNLLVAIVHSAGIQDRVAARAVLMRLFCRFDTITTIFVDGGYTGTLIDWAKEMFGYTIKVIKRNEQKTFKVLPKRWIVERTFAWLNWSRRLSKDYELRHTSAETMIHIAFCSSTAQKINIVLKQVLRARAQFENVLLPSLAGFT